MAGEQEPKRLPGLGVQELVILRRHISTFSMRYSLDAYRLQGPQVPCCDKHHSFIYFQDHHKDQGAWRKYWGGLKVHLGDLGGAVLIYN